MRMLCVIRLFKGNRDSCLILDVAMLLLFCYVDPSLVSSPKETAIMFPEMLQIIQQSHHSLPFEWHIWRYATQLLRLLLLSLSWLIWKENRFWKVSLQSFLLRYNKTPFFYSSSSFFQRCSWRGEHQSAKVLDCPGVPVKHLFSMF